MGDDFFKIILENLDNIVLVRDKNNKIIYCNNIDFIKNYNFVTVNGILKDRKNGDIYQHSVISVNDDYIIDSFIKIDSMYIENYNSKYETDCVTKLPVRLKIDEYLNYITRTDDSYIFAMIDIDDFKHVNDTYGHDQGDKVLYAIGKILRDNLRRDDFVGRYGGEEFLMIIHSDNLEMIEERLNIIRTQINNYYFTTKQNEIFNVSISIGAALYTKDDTASTIIKYADEALYYVKNNGKNSLKIHNYNVSQYVKKNDDM